MLTPEEVRHVAMLARLGLSDREIEQMRVQLLDVLAYVDQLQKVDTSAIEPTAQVLAQANVMRQDVPRPSWPPEDILSNAPATMDQFFMIPAVLEEGRGAEEALEEEETAASELAGGNTGEEEIG